MVKLVPSTTAHVQALYGKSLPVTIQGIAGVEGGRVLGIGAIYAEGGCMVITCRIAEEARADLHRHARAILTSGRRLLEIAARYRLPVRCIADPRYPRAAALLEHLGFRSIGKDVFQWTPST
ncbi:MAG: hypothetical protein NUV34_07725 [Sulfuricaulis sp.]|nr:hypothetical protein [Sulfuricaulis sp.]